MSETNYLNVSFDPNVSIEQFDFEKEKCKSFPIQIMN